MKDKIPKDEWYVRRAMSNMQEEDDSTNASNRSNKDEKQEDKDEKPERKTVRIKKGWGQFLQLKQDAEPQFKQMKNKESYLDDEIILDTGSTIKATFKNKNLLANISKSTAPILMNTNTGSKLIEEKGTVIGFGDAWYNEKLLGNIFGFAGTVDMYRIMYDSEIEDAFNVYTENGVIKFKWNKDGLYTYKSTE